MQKVAAAVVYLVLASKVGFVRGTHGLSHSFSNAPSIAGEVLDIIPECLC